MKKIVFLLLIALCLPIGLMAQSYDDDLYFIPSKEKEEEPAPAKKEPVRRETTTNIYTTPGTTVVIQDRKGNTRDVDEYNRRYDARDNDFEMDNDTLYIKEKDQPDLDGEWVNGEFNGSQDDYEYAERIIRFRNPRFAVSISSPFYWDVVYGMNSWDWTYIPMDFMPMHSLHSAIRYGGIGDIIPMVRMGLGMVTSLLWMGWLLSRLLGWLVWRLVRWLVRWRLLGWSLGTPSWLLSRMGWRRSLLGQ